MRLKRSRFCPFDTPNPASKCGESMFDFINQLNMLLAERVGFEPTVRLPARRFSRPLP
ncbi:hypothetical protein CHELA40_14769 [Chelatococcus asaccharovorans]|nr:hypothetical protein CHELA17_60852 [Chelatococcus asaccharovorans]CAH1679849.1 hypothetical protein CHELA40_14769 [Chelatococcus asaccharovorans]